VKVWAFHFVYDKMKSAISDRKEIIPDVWLKLSSAQSRITPIFLVKCEAALCAASQYFGFN
ncbi:MAG: hypothetical protein WCQ26_10770, partial [Pseudanabaena sp. ELA748]